MPVVGWGASAVNTVYVDRNDKDSRVKTKNEISGRIKNGRSVIIFPEGTTGSGNGLLPLKPGMFHVAAANGFPIIPAVIFYENRDLPWFGDDGMASNFYRNFKKWSTTVHVVFGEPMIGTNGEELVERYRSWSVGELKKLEKQFRKQVQSKLLLFRIKHIFNSYSSKTDTIVAIFFEQNTYFASRQNCH